MLLIVTIQALSAGRLTLVGGLLDDLNKVQDNAVQLEILWRIDRRDTGFFQGLGIARRNNPAHHYRHLTEARVSQTCHDVLHKRQVRS